MPTGILPLLKPAGMTSHDCVYRIRKLFQTKKVGHTGTLDPSVTGVLPICIGRATKVAEYMSDFGKTYEAEVTLGFSTITEDADGEVLESKPVYETWSEAEIHTTLQSFIGEQTQIPPMYSAVKVNGKKLYEYARANQTVIRPERTITVYDMSLLSINKKTDHTFSIAFSVRCSKGTYIRTLAVAIGEALGYPSHMSNLIRTASGPYTISDCITLDALKEMELEEREQQLRPFQEVLNDWPRIVVDQDVEIQVRHGAVLPTDVLGASERVTVYTSDHELLAIYKPHPSKSAMMKPEKMFLSPVEEQSVRKVEDG